MGSKRRLVVVCGAGMTRASACAVKNAEFVTRSPSFLVRFLRKPHGEIFSVTLRSC